jgi:hypothetical protein
MVGEDIAYKGGKKKNFYSTIGSKFLRNM